MVPLELLCLLLSATAFERDKKVARIMVIEIAIIFFMIFSPFNIKNIPNNFSSLLANDTINFENFKKIFSEDIQ